MPDVGKAALIHDVISHHHLDVLIVTETWMRADQPPAIVDDIAALLRGLSSFPVRWSGWMGGDRAPA